MAKGASPEKLRQMTKPDVDIGASWRELNSELDAPESSASGWWWISGLGLAMSATLIVVLASAWNERDDVLEVPTRILADGSTLHFEPGTVAKIETDTALHVGIVLTEGVGTFTVTKNPRRQFEVVAGGTTVRVVGTRFSVERHADETVDVEVDEGMVEVRTAQGSQMIREGESWSSEVSVETTKSDQPDAEFSNQQLQEEPTENRVDTRKTTGTLSQPGPALHSKSIDAEAKVETPDGLFDAARKETQEGRYREAVEILSRFLKRYGDDDRAGWVAFEIARLAMDHLSDFSRTERMLRRALELEPGAAFVPDVLARQVSVLEALGQWDRCIAVREDYLDRFPLGAHVPQVREACSH